jgi:hydroxyacid-oxoacid transhydrogenase
MAYPVAGMAASLSKPYVPQAYQVSHALVPHGMAVILNAPAVFRFTAPANPALHLEAARLMGVDIRGASPADAGDLLAGRLVEILRAVGMPNGLGALGYGAEHVAELVAGTLPQHRVTKLSPRPASAEDLRALFLASMTLYPPL